MFRVRNGLRRFESSHLRQERKNMLTKEISLIEYIDLCDKKLFVNKYGMELKYMYELLPYWKAFCFDVLKETKEKGVQLPLDIFFIMKKFELLKKVFNLSIDIKDYLELTDYIPFSDWIAAGNKIEFTNFGVKLIQK